MSDKYQGFVSSPIGKLLVKNLGLPNPTRLDRYNAGDPLVDGTVLVGGKGRLAESLTGLLDVLGIASATSPDAAGERARFKGIVFDATGIKDSTELIALRDFFTPVLRSLEDCARVVVIGTPPKLTSGPERVAQRALEGFTRSLGKEIGKGSTVQLVYVAEGSEAGVSSTLGFLLSPKSAYVSARSSGSASTGRRRSPRWPTRPGRSPARSPSSPAPAVASASRSPGPCTVTARPSSASTCRRPRASCRP